MPTNAPSFDVEDQIEGLWAMFGILTVGMYAAAHKPTWEEAADILKDTTTFMFTQFEEPYKSLVLGLLAGESFTELIEKLNLGR